jgi:phospholipase C
VASASGRGERKELHMKRTDESLGRNSSFRIFTTSGLLLCFAPACNEAGAQSSGPAVAIAAAAPLPAAPSGVGHPTTPIKHLVVLFQENVPFDRYFGVYPNALNPPGEPPFVAKPDTPTVNGLTETLLTENPNSANPHRLDRTQQNVCGSNHGYTAEQHATTTASSTSSWSSPGTTGRAAIRPSASATSTATR